MDVWGEAAVPADDVLGDLVAFAGLDEDEGFAFVEDLLVVDGFFFGDAEAGECAEDSAGGRAGRCAADGGSEDAAGEDGTHAGDEGGGRRAEEASNDAAGGRAGECAGAVLGTFGVVEHPALNDVAPADREAHI